MTEIDVNTSPEEGPSRLFFDIGGTGYAILTEEVERVVDAATIELFTVPLMDQRTAGLISLRGQPVAVLRFPCLAQADLPAREGVYIVISAEGERFAFLVQAVRAVRRSADDENVVTVCTADLLKSILADEPH